MAWRGVAGGGRDGAQLHARPRRVPASRLACAWRCALGTQRPHVSNQGPTIPLTGLDFAGVHDSFWTHAGTVERMNELLREKFVELHSQVRGCGRGRGGEGMRAAAATRPPQPPHPPSAPTHPPQPLLEELLSEFQRLYPGIEFPPLPQRGELDLANIREATYFFS